MLAVRQGSLGHIRYIMKNDLKWFPLYGFYFQQVLKKINNKIKLIYLAWLYLCSS